MAGQEAGWQKVQTVATGLFALGAGTLPTYSCLMDRSNEGMPDKRDT